MNCNIIVFILLILFYFCRKTVSVVHIAFTDNLSSSGFASTELPKQRFCVRFCVRNCNSVFSPWFGISPCRLRRLLFCFPPAMTFDNPLLDWSWLLNIPPYWMFLWNILKYTTTLIAQCERGGYHIWHIQLHLRGNSQGVENFITISLFVFCGKGFWPSPLSDFFFFFK